MKETKTTEYWNDDHETKKSIDCSDATELDTHQLIEIDERYFCDDHQRRNFTVSDPSSLEMGINKLSIKN